jgi:thymidylate synthase
MTKTDLIYRSLIAQILESDEKVITRNAEVFRSFTIPTILFTSTPLVTVRKTAWKKAIREMEWFLSGSPKCPDELLDWWDGQLNSNGYYLSGYGEQLRAFDSRFDQIENLLHGIHNHPYSRRHVITTWHPEEMAEITKLNKNPKTPATCHTTLAQFFCSPDGGISMRSYQRSADMLLGAPHNWIQSWALLMWVAEKTGRVCDKMLWTFGDAHIYAEESHLRAAREILDAPRSFTARFNGLPKLCYEKSSVDFRAEDFCIVGEIPSPVSVSRPKLL